MQRRNLRATFAVGLACALTLAACGGDDSDSDGDADDTESTDAPAPTEDSGADAPGDVSSTDAPSGTSGGSDSAASGGAVSDEEWAEIEAAAKEEGKVVVYSVMLPNQNESMEAGFEAAYPEIDMEVIRLMGGDVEARLDAERETGTEGADIAAHINYEWVTKAAEAGDLVEMVGPDARGPVWENGGWVPDGLYQYTAFQVLGIGCNTELVEECPTSFEEIVDPKFKGRIGAVEPGHQVLMDFWMFMEDQIGGEDGLRELHELDPVFYASAVPAQQGLAAGEVAVTTYATNQLVTDAEAGAPVEFIVPKPNWSPPILSYILGWAKHPNAAQVALNWMATPEGQTAITINGASALPDIEGTLADVDDLQVLDVINNTAEWAAPHQERWNEIFER